MKEKVDRIINNMTTVWKKNTAKLARVLKRWGQRVKKAPLYFKIAAVYIVATLVLTGIFLWKARTYYPEIQLGREGIVRNADHGDEKERHSGSVSSGPASEAVIDLQPDEAGGATDMTVADGERTVNPGLLWPVEGGAKNVEVGFGETISFTSRGSTSTRIHRGIDICVPEGSAVIASAEGEVVEVKEFDALYGSSILIKHVDDIHTFYGNLAEINVQAGDGVEGGRIIGKVGRKAILDSGLERPYLHYEIRLGQKSVDPIKYLP